MKISASIYSNKGEDLSETLKKLDESGVDLLHVDCNDNLSVFEDIQLGRKITEIPVDLHIITEKPSKYYDYLDKCPVEYVTFQHEDMKEALVKPESSTSKWGLAITTDTPISVFEDYDKDMFDFILIMATVPGQSGGVFDKINFKKIREFRRKHPDKKIHVDGGVNAEVSFILRNMGVYASVSGSYLFKQDSVGQALLQLQSREIESDFRIKDFMISLDNSPVVSYENLNFVDLLQKIEHYKMGFCMVSDESGKLYGISSNADVRKALIMNSEDLNKATVDQAINKEPKFITENSTVKELLALIKGLSFPILYLPIVDSKKNIKGSITFQNLIKGEL
ncbi:MAG: ribulose-phosphate 3-epimerase [Patiriisocius sp.]|jgi:ribulose-phosphate 3-epimerase